MATPLHTVKESFGSKETLVEKLAPLLDRREDENEAQLKERLLRVSNRKLLRLMKRAESLRDNHGSREALADKIVAARFGEKGDDAHRRKLLTQPTGRLLSLYAGAARKSKG